MSHSKRSGEPRVRVTSDRQVLGWREWLSLPELGIREIRAKIDTGARSSSLHVESYQELLVDGVERVRFVVKASRKGREVICEADIVDRRDVTDSSGHRTRRVFIRTLLDIRGERYPIEVNLTSRHQMLFPMLLGRTAIAGRWVVDPELSFVQGRVRGRRKPVPAT